MGRKKTKEKTDNLKLEPIDKFALDEEWIRQDNLLGKYGEMLADAMEEVDRLKSKIEVKSAELAKKVRSDPDRYGITKITNEPVNQVVEIKLQKTGLSEKLIEAEHDVAVYKAMVSRLHNRSKAISDLIFLFSIDYYGPKKGKNTKRGIEEMREYRMEKRLDRRRK